MTWNFQILISFHLKKKKKEKKKEKKKKKKRKDFENTIYLFENQQFNVLGDVFMSFSSKNKKF